MAVTAFEKGRHFEQMIQAFLAQGFYAERFRQVWRWADWIASTHPEQRRTDVGIDLVAEDETGHLWAIQAKDHQEKVSWNALSTFVATARRPDYHFDRLLVVVTHDLTDEAWRQCQEQGIAVLTLEDLDASAVDWAHVDSDHLTALPRRHAAVLRPYQEEALAAIATGFQQTDRGKCIMPPGTGKTLVALRVAEQQAGLGQTVLFCAPSIALVNQTIKAWQRDATMPLRFVAVTSDRTVGKKGDDEGATALIIPPTTQAEDLAQAAQAVPDAMTVVVSTYQSLPVVAEAHRLGLPRFACALADEAHRTTGHAASDEERSAFLLFHDQKMIPAEKRLYLTATPRIFETDLTEKLQQAGHVAMSMDDYTIFGPEFFRYTFRQGVAAGYLADYQVVALVFAEQDVQRAFMRWLQEQDAPSVPELIRVEGLWKALATVRNEQNEPLERLIVYVNSVNASKQLAKDFARCDEQHEDRLAQTYQVLHIDGTMSMATRSTLLHQLEQPEPGTGTVLANAQVLTEGIDVPALDAVVFLEPRRSRIDVIQAVGRVMRKPPDRPDKVGYIIVPVLLDSPDATQQLAGLEEHVLASDKAYRPLLQILNALRSLDESMDVRIRHLIQDHGLGEGTEDPDAVVKIRFDTALPESLQAAIQKSLTAKIIEPVTNERYFRDFTDTIARVTRYLRTQLHSVLEDPTAEATTAFRHYHQALQTVLHPQITAEEAQDFLVQHWLLAPIFDTLFPGESLTTAPVAAAFERITGVFRFFLERERQELTDFYRRVTERAKGLRNAAERQDFLRYLFEQLFQSAFPAAADRLGIVYTPVELVDFLVASVDGLLADHFGKTLADPGVTVIDPFAGTGTFPARVLERWDAATIRRKIAVRELWANDVQLFAYYVLLTNLQWQIREKTGEVPDIRQMPVLWTDSFQLQEDQGTFHTTFFDGDYTALMTAQREAPITVVIGNPPWRTGQKSANDANKNLTYSRLDARIANTYVAHSTAHNKNSLYDAYIRAFRWASDRIGAQGIVGFVTNAGWIDGNAMDGLRKTLVHEFAALYVLNLRGDIRGAIRAHDREAAQREGESVFPIQAAAALVLLVKDPSHHGPTTIFYCDIGDYLRREEKLARVADFGDVKRVPWQQISPNAAGDWINQRSTGFEQLMPLGGDSLPPEIGCEIRQIFSLRSRGLETSRDAWVYDFSRESLVSKMQRMIAFYQTQLGKPEGEQDNDPQRISWSRGLRNDARRGKSRTFQPTAIVPALYRPFTKQWLYFDRTFNNVVSQQPRLFPWPGAENRVIMVNGTGENSAFSCLMSNIVPDLHVVGTSQCFPRYVYTFISADGLNTEPHWERDDAIPDYVLENFHTHYQDPQITKDDIFDYVYGVLHAPDYREAFAVDLKKVLPRVPWAPDFWTVAQIGHQLAALHLDYDTLEPWPLTEHVAPNAPSDVWARYAVEKMQWAKKWDKTPDQTTLKLNEWVTLGDIPAEALGYQVNGRAPIEWVMDQYRVKLDKPSGIVKDANAWAHEQNNPRYPVELIGRVVRVAVETQALVRQMPSVVSHSS